jgi:hypothetical protein
MRKIYILFIFLTGLQFNSSAQLFGNFTVDPSGGGDYTTIQKAINALYHNNIVGKVNIYIEPGVYEEQLVVPFIFGSSFINTVNLIGLRKNGQEVIVRHKPDTITDNFTLSVYQAQYTNFQSITFQTDTSLGTCVDIRKGCNYVTFDSCNFIGKPSGNNLVFSPCENNSNDNNLTFKNSEFWYGSVGIFMCTASTQEEQNNKVQYCKFYNQSDRGIAFGYQGSPEIDGNTIISDTNQGGYYGILVDNCNNAVKITNNKINLDKAGVFSSGISNYKTSGSFGNYVMIYNNMISMQSNDVVFAFAVTNSQKLEIYFNSVLVDGNNASSSAMSISIGNDITMRNNVFANYAGGYSTIVSGMSNFVTDHNNHYSKSSALGLIDNITVPDLQTWQTKTGQGIGSKSIDPEFCSETSLYTFNDSLNGAGYHLLFISEDIDGQNRKNPPDIGANEFDLVDLQLGSDWEFCLNETQQFDAGNFFDTYLWPDSSMNQTYTFLADKDGDTTIVGKAYLKECEFIDTVNIMVNPLPKFSLGADTTIYTPDFDTFFLNGPLGSNKYLWQNNTDKSFLQVIDTFTKIGDQDFVFWLEVTDSNLCSYRDSINITINKPASIAEIRMSKIMVFPNPASDILYFESESEKINQITIVNQAGKVIEQKELVKERYIDVSDFEKGYYILKIITDNGLMHSGFIKN